MIILYGSMLTTSLVSALLGMMGKKAKFIVTPKTSKKTGILFAIRFQIKEFIFSSVLLACALVFSNSVFPVVLIVVTGYLSILLLFFSNKKYSNKEVIEIDRKTSEISLKINKEFQYSKNLDNITAYTDCVLEKTK